MKKFYSLEAENRIGATVKPVLSSHSKIDKTKVLMTGGSLVQVVSTGAFCNTFDLH